MLEIKPRNGEATRAGPSSRGTCEDAVREHAVHARAVRVPLVRERILLAWVLYALARSGQALAGDSVPIGDVAAAPAAANPRPPTISMESLLAPPFQAERSLAEPQQFSSTDFRPRRHESAAGESSRQANFSLDGSTLHTKTTWQEMSQFKSQDRLRLLTLWEASGSTLSLQAGRRGGPSLQWSSPWVRRQGTVHAALLDRLFSVPEHGLGSSIRINPPHPGAAAISKPAELVPGSVK